jgi:hypothetical protein
LARRSILTVAHSHSLEASRAKLYSPSPPVSNAADGGDGSRSRPTCSGLILEGKTAYIIIDIIIEVLRVIILLLGLGKEGENYFAAK